MFSKTLVFAFIGAFLIVGALGDNGVITDAVIANCEKKDTKEERNACYHEATGIQEDVVGCIDIDEVVQSQIGVSLPPKTKIGAISTCVEEAAGEKIGACDRWMKCKKLLDQWFVNYKHNTSGAV